jgi:hypothetical protein
LTRGETLIANAHPQKELTMARNAPKPRRSVKAGRPPVETPGSPSVKRRQKSARAAVRKDTMILQSPDGPRVLWGRTRPQVKKR